MQPVRIDQRMPFSKLRVSAISEHRRLEFVECAKSTRAVPRSSRISLETTRRSVRLKQTKGWPI
jgi:hypothetical protein